MFDSYGCLFRDEQVALGVKSSAWTLAVIVAAWLLLALVCAT